MNELDKLHEQILALEMENHELRQKLVEQEYEQFSLQSIQKLAKAGNWKLNHLSYEVELSPELIDILGLSQEHRLWHWNDFTALLAKMNTSDATGHLVAPPNEGISMPYLYLDYVRPDGGHIHLKHFSKTFLNTIGQPLRTVGLVQDVSEERKQARSLELQSITDELTGLYNRRRINEVLQQELDREDAEFSLILLDLDFFKQVNDTYGHLFGDKVLKHLARLLQLELPAPAVCARWGGEEFLVLLPDHSLSQASAIAARVRHELAKFHLPDGSPTTASFGVTQRAMGEDISGLLSRVDHLMYTAKQSGRDRICSAKASEDDSQIITDA